MTEEIMSAVSGEVFSVWFLIGAAFVFFMQAGFAMVEAGFTRAKNAGNIIMKNLMDFCIGTCVFIPLGFGILLGEDALGGLRIEDDLDRYKEIVEDAINVISVILLSWRSHGSEHRECRAERYSVRVELSRCPRRSIEASWNMQ